MPRKSAAQQVSDLKVFSEYIGQWIVRPLASLIRRESEKLERLLEAVRLESYEHGELARDKVIQRIDELEKSIEIMAREMASKEGVKAEDNG